MSLKNKEKKVRQKKYCEPPDLNTHDGYSIYSNDFMYIDLVLQNAIYNFEDDDKKKVEFVNTKLPKVLGLIRRIEEAIDLHYSNNICKKKVNDNSDLDNYPEKTKRFYTKLRKKIAKMNIDFTNDHRKTYYELINSDPN